MQISQSDCDIYAVLQMIHWHENMPQANQVCNWYPPKTVTKLIESGLVFQRQMKIIWYNECFTMLNWTHDQLMGSSSSFLSPLYLHGRQWSKVQVQICVNAPMIHSWLFCTPARMDCHKNATVTVVDLTFLKPPEAESKMWVSF